MNKVLFMGRLVADPEYSVSQTGTTMCKFRIAVNRAYSKPGEDKQSDFFQIVSFGKTAEFVSRYFTKGKPIIIEGRIQNNNYTDQNGVKQYHNQLIADTVGFTLNDHTKAANGGQNYQQQNQQYQPNNYQQGYQQHPQMHNYQQNVQHSESLDDYGEMISDGQLPF